VIAHSVSVMVIQAGGARLVMGDEPKRAEESLRSVERAGREALAEMRRLLGILGDGDLRALAPQPGLANIAPLLAHARTAGVSAVLHVAGDPTPVPPALDLCAYRIVQEALTNTIKHAAPASASVKVRWEGSALELEISDDGRRGRAVNGTTGGHGITGMRERVALHSGTLETGARPEGGFAVLARLPLAPEGEP
jgi:signal transduction histidine kinase